MVKRKDECMGRKGGGDLNGGFIPGCHPIVLFGPLDPCRQCDNRSCQLLNKSLSSGLPGKLRSKCQLFRISRCKVSARMSARMSNLNCSFEGGRSL